jgi:hypothetical protein
MNSNKVSILITVFVVLCAAMVLSGCTSPTPSATPAPTETPTAAPTATPVPGAMVLSITGMVNTTQNLSLADLKGMTQYTAAWQNNAGNASYNGTGPKLLDLLNKAGLQSNASNITFFSTDNYNTSMTLADLNGKYNDSIVAWDWTGLDKNGTVVTNTNNTLQVIVPAGGSKNQAKLLSEIVIS